MTELDRKKEGDRSGYETAQLGEKSIKSQRDICVDKKVCKFN